MQPKQTKNSHLLILDENKVARIEPFVYGAKRENSAYYAELPGFFNKSWIKDDVPTNVDMQYLTLNKTSDSSYYIEVKSGNEVKSKDVISWMPISKVDWRYEGVIPPVAEYTFGLYFLKYLDKQIKIVSDNKSKAMEEAVKQLSPSIVQQVRYIDRSVNPEYDAYKVKASVKPF